jgi:transglutaminase-like putative cysteine protease
LEHRQQRANCAAFVASETAERHGGGLLFTGVTLLLSIPVYLFVPKPGDWRSAAETTDPHVYRDMPVAQQAPTPLEPLASSSQPPQPRLGGAPDSTPAPLIESVKHIARPESGDYGEDFGIADVVRHPAFANNIVLYVRSSRPVNLRGRIYDRFSNDRWSRTFAESQRIQLEGRSLVLLSQPAGPTRIEQAIEVARDLDPTLVHAPGLQQLRFPGTSLLRYDDGVIVANAPLRTGTAYSADSRLTLRAGRYLLLEPPPRDLTPYLRAEAASPRLRELAAKVSASSASKLAKALALEQHLRTHYAYTYETLAQQNHTPLDWFLFEGRRGHCEFFASALAMMLRSVGIPSRVATGFTLADPNPITGFHEVRALDGHAWVEAYLDGGWLMLEPTPFYPLPRPAIDRQVAEQMDGYLERLATTRELLEPGTLEHDSPYWHGICGEARAPGSMERHMQCAHSAGCCHWS